MRCSGSGRSGRASGATLSPATGPTPVPCAKWLGAPPFGYPLRREKTHGSNSISVAHTQPVLRAFEASPRLGWLLCA